MAIVTKLGDLEWRSVRQKFAFRSDTPAKLYHRAIDLYEAKQAARADTCLLYYAYDNSDPATQYEHVGHLIADVSHSPKALLVLSLDAAGVDPAMSVELAEALLEKARRLTLKHRCKHLIIPCPKSDLYAGLCHRLAKHARSINNDTEGLPVLWHEFTVSSLPKLLRT